MLHVPVRSVRQYRKNATSHTRLIHQLTFLLQGFLEQAHILVFRQRAFCVWADCSIARAVSELLSEPRNLGHPIVSAFVGFYYGATYQFQTFCVIWFMSRIIVSWHMLDTHIAVMLYGPIRSGWVPYKFPICFWIFCPNVIRSYTLRATVPPKTQHRTPGWYIN